MLSPDIAKRLLEGDKVNLAKRVKQGKPLTAGQRALLASLASGGGVSAVAHAGSWVELAALLGVSRRTLKGWSDRFPDAPKADSAGRHDVTAWRNFMQKYGLEGRKAKADSEGPDKKAADARRAEADAEMAEIELAKLKGTAIGADVMGQRLIELAGKQQALLRSKLENEYPLVVAGMEPAEVRKKGKELVDQLCQLMQQLVEEWK